MGSESIETAIVSKPLSPSGKFFLPGFRFHPTDEELVLYYLKRKICGRSLKLNIIGEVDVYKWDPEELPGKSKWKTGDRQWFFFSPRDRKYANGGRSSRATFHGYWKATGKDRIIKCNSRAVGVKKTLVYYQGRAPSGQRTNWVMHEYTLDEEELGRCRYVQEYYALCKVFKKSGLGPKNGEQYGAPFVEEEWSDDDHYLVVDALLVQKISSVINEPEIVPPLAQINLVNVEEESQDSLLVRSLTKVDFLDQAIAMGPRHEVLDVQPGSDLAQSANEPSVEELQPLVINEDFLEMDDLIDPKLPSQNTESLVLEDLQVADFDAFNEFDLYDNLTRLNEMNPFETQDIQQPYYTHNLEYGIQDSGFHSYSNCTGSEDVNAELQTGYDLWTHDQSPCDFTAAQLTDDFIAARATDSAMSAPSSGVITDENPGNPDSGVIQCRKTREDDGTDSWFSSALWDFVESVPTTPASALESNALVNKACERMSGLSRVRNANKAAVGGGVKCSLARRSFEPSSRSSSGIVYFSVLGVLFAMLCIFVGTSIKLLGRCSLL